MKEQAVKTFFNAANDLEQSQYKLLSFLKFYSNEFKNLRLYPSLTELIEIGSMIEEVLDSEFLFERDFTKAIFKMDIMEKFAMIEPIEFNDAQIEKILEFVKWAVPRIKDTINDGKVVFDFIDENIETYEIGLKATDEINGIFAVPNVAKNVLEVYKYDISSNADEDEIRTLKTEVLARMNLDMYKGLPLERIKLKLQNQFSELPNKSIFYFKTDLDLPFDESILPIVKRKLIQKLAF